jgi:hypothetical protein
MRKDLLIAGIDFRRRANRRLACVAAYLGYALALAALSCLRTRLRRLGLRHSPWHPASGGRLVGAEPGSRSLRYRHDR